MLREMSGLGQPPRRRRRTYMSPEVDQLAQRAVWTIDMIFSMGRTAIIESRRRDVERLALKSISSNNAYAGAQELFAFEATPRLCKAAVDDLSQIRHAPPGRRAAAIHRWTQQWEVNTVGMREWAAHQIDEWERFDLGTNAVTVDWAPGTWLLDPLTFATRKDYLNAVASWAKEQWESCRRRNGRETRLGPQINEHCRWLARYQVSCEGFSDIARSVGKHRQSVSSAVKSVAHLLDLPLRSPTVGGRPKKKTRSRNS